MKKLLVIGYVWPEPNSSAAGSRMLQLLKVFSKQGYRIFYASPAVVSEHMADLEALSITKVSIKLNDSSFDNFIEELNPDVVLFDRFMMEEQFSWRVEKYCPDAIRLLETVDLHCLRQARHEAVKKNIDATAIESLELKNELALREVASILRCDLSLLISEVEIKILNKVFHVNKDLLLYLPFMYDSIDKGSMENKWPDFTDRRHFVTIGNFRHAPNWDSVLYLKNTVWPIIRSELKDIELHIYGSYLPKKAQQLHNEKQGFLIKGWANDALDTLSQHRVCLSPLRFGAGMKGKLVDAMLCGTPSITTQIGAESMSGNYSWPGFICESETELASSAIELYKEQELWKEKQFNGLDIINNVFNFEQNESRFVNKLNSTINSLQKMRKNNFTGMMLRHHTMKSAMYMSQWIEAKNKIKD